MLVCTCILRTNARVYISILRTNACIQSYIRGRTHNVWSYLCLHLCLYTDTRHIQVLQYGFDIKEEAERTCYYTQNPNSMMHTIYNCAFFVAIKKPSRGLNPGFLDVLVFLMFLSARMHGV